MKNKLYVYRNYEVALSLIYGYICFDLDFTIKIYTQNKNTDTFIQFNSSFVIQCYWDKVLNLSYLGGLSANHMLCLWNREDRCHNT